MKQICIILTTVLLQSTAALAQTFKPTDHWTAGSSGSDGIWDIAIDTAGNQYICGYFTGTVDIDPGPGVYNLTQPSGQTQEDAFLLKLDANGNFVWAKHFGGTIDSYRTARGVELDDFGNVYVFGLYRGDIRFESNSALWTTASSGVNYSPFLAKFSTSGQLQWGYGWFSPAKGLIWEVQIDQNQDVYLAGLFTGTFDFNPLPGPGNVNSLTSSGSDDMFISKLSSNGSLLKAEKLGGIGSDRFNAMFLTDEPKLYLAGSFSNVVDLELGNGVSSFTSGGQSDGFIMKIDTNFHTNWIRVFGGSGGVFCRKLKVHGNKLVVFGEYNQSIDIDPSPSVSQLIYSNGDQDLFLQNMDTSGVLNWAITIGGTGDDSPRGLSLGQSFQINCSGHFENTVDFDPSSGNDYLLTSLGGLDGYVFSLDSSGTFLNAARFGSNTSVGVPEVINSVETGFSMSYFHTGGNFYNTIDINPSSLVTQNVTSAGQDDMLYMVLDACLNQIVQYTANVCGSQFVLPSGGVVTQSGYYLDVVLSSQSCDSTNGITVVLNPLPDTAITQTGATFTAQPGLSYQWFNCQSNQPIAGETNQTFTATANGQYAVIVSNGTCTDTSTCIVLDNIGLPEANLPVVNIYPNPTNGVLRIETTAAINRIEVVDLTGRLLIAKTQTPEELDLSSLPKGVYLVKVFVAEDVVMRRVLRE